MFLKGWDLLKLGVNPVLILNVQWLGIEFEIYKKKKICSIQQHPSITLLIVQSGTRRPI